jgi:uncharacterized protein YdhG (YjbR/CyaY superfamily)
MTCRPLISTATWSGSALLNITLDFIPRGSAVEAFKEELSAYKREKATVQFPLDQPIPYQLIRKIVKFRVAENQKK